MGNRPSEIKMLVMGIPKLFPNADCCSHIHCKCVSAAPVSELISLLFVFLFTVTEIYIGSSEGDFW